MFFALKNIRQDILRHLKYVINLSNKLLGISKKKEEKNGPIRLLKHCKNKGARRVSLGDVFFPFKTSNPISLARVDAKRHLPAINFDQVTVEMYRNVF